MQQQTERLTQLIEFHKKQAAALLNFYNFNGQQFFAVYQERVTGDPEGKHIDPVIIDTSDEIAQFKQVVSGLIAWHNIKAFEYGAIVNELQSLKGFRRVLSNVNGLLK